MTEISLIYCFDLDGTLSAHPLEFGPMMRALKKDGHQVQILTGYKGPTMSEDVLKQKAILLDALGLGDAYTAIVGFANLKNKVAHQKADYMSIVGAHLLIDNKKVNVKAAAQMGMVGLRVEKSSVS
jgi:hypothetical protein